LFKEKTIEVYQENTKMLYDKEDISFLACQEDTMNLRPDPQILNKVHKYNILKDNKIQSDTKYSSSALGQRKR